MPRKCLVCSPRFCQSAYLYVVADELRGLVKIGCTVNISKRMAKYRSNGNTFYRLVYWQRAGCRFTSIDKEQRAINKLNRDLRIFGDWFKEEEATAVAAVTSVLTRKKQGVR